MTKQIPQGYKQTKLGMIPEDWDVSELGNVANIYDGTHMTPTYTSEGVPFYSVETITNDEWNITKFISEEVFEQESKRVKIEHGDILMTRIGDIGTPKFINWHAKASFYVSLALIKNKSKMSFKYLTQYIQSHNFQNELHKRTIHVAFPKKINLGEINHCNIIKPPLKEQEKIAEILSTWDDAIAKQEQFIEQKQVFKKGIMQQILSQKPRFKDDNGNNFPAWQTKKLGEVLFFIRNNSFSRSQLNLNSGVAQNIHYGDIHTKFNNYIDVANAIIPYINEDVDIESIQNHEYCQDGDLIIADASEDYKDVGKSVEIKNIGTKRILSGLHTILARNKISFALGFKAYLIQSTQIRSQIKKIANGISVLGISKTNLANILLEYPCLEEQTKIADFLTSIDDEITKQTEVLDQLKLQKQSLMQKLLTGQVRVINKGN